MQRLVLLALDPRLPRKLAQLLTIGAHECSDEFVQCIVAFGNEPIAPCFYAMQMSCFFVRQIAIVLKRCADRLEFFIVELAHLLGQKLRLALMRDLLRNAARADHLV